MTLWLTAVSPTRRPRLTNSTTVRAPVYVLPEPGGPCTGRIEVRKESTKRLAASVKSSLL